MIASLTGRRIIVAALSSARVDDPEADLAQHAARIVSKGGIVVAHVIQRRGVSSSKQPGGARRLAAPMDPATYFGKGKVQEIAELRRATGAELVVVCARLPEQDRHIAHRQLELRRLHVPLRVRVEPASGKEDDAEFWEALSTLAKEAGVNSFAP